VAYNPERNDRRAPRANSSAPPKPWRGKEDGGAEWLWGRHAVEAALSNPHRTRFRRLVAGSGKAESLGDRVWSQLTGERTVRPETMETHEIARLLPPGAVHQGLALLADPLESVPLDEMADPAEGVLILLDQVEDPQNVGAVFRAAAAFGAKGVILQERRAPALAGTVAKASAGAVDKVPCTRVVNLSRALEQLTDLGWRAVGLAGAAETTLEEALDGRPVVLVLGSEGDGLRRLVSEHCDVLARIPMPGDFESLNIATAAAIALYEASRPKSGA
jgi:23S rRNA (guanosine2251-2'-O)-methyltransferase